MNQQSEGYVQRIRGKIRSLWGDITDDDFDRVSGNVDQLVGLIKQKTGEAEDAIRQKLNRAQHEEEEKQQH